MDPSDVAVLTPQLSEVALGVGQVLCESGDLPESVFFPSSSVISVVALLSDGRSFETASIGFEGVSGLLAGLTGIPSPTRTFVQIGGGAMRLPASALRARTEESPSFTKLVLRHAQVDAALAEQSVACNASHHLSERLAKWLLITQDRIDSAIIALTQDYLGVMVGALRSSISLTAGEFKKAGLIDYSRGRLEILDRPGLERRVCECYAVDRASHALLLPAV
jgi:CRP-like cAMP-binding protein